MGITSTLKRARVGIVRRLLKGAGREQFFSVTTPTWQQGRPANWSEDPKEQVEHYKHWVFAAVQSIAFKVAATDLRLHVKRGDEIQQLDEHPFLTLMSHVNPLHTRFWLWAQTMTFLELTGNAYWYVARDGLGLPGEIWVAHSQYMKVIPGGRQSPISGYEYRNGNDKVTFDPDEIIHFKYPNPKSAYYGRGPLQAAAESVDAHEALKEAEWRAFQQGIMPGLALQTDQQLGASTIERLQTDLQLKHGGPAKAGKTLVLDQGLKASPVSLSPREMDFMRSSKLTRTEILGIFRVPDAVAGLSEDVNRSVAEAMDLIFARYCVAPKLELIQQQLNQDLVSTYDPRLFCKFARIVPVDREQEREDEKADLEHGVRTINDILRERGEKPVPWGDKPWFQAQMIQVDGSEAPEDEPEDEETEQ